MKTNIALFLLTIMFLFAGCEPKKQQPAEPAAAAPVTDTLTKKIITARVYVKPEKVADFLEAARSIIDSSRAEAGCESYNLYQNPYEKTKLIFVEIWKDQVAIDNHFSMSYFKAFGPKTKDWLLQPTELKIFDVTPNE
jgi:quinol monooxygenase YgiN